MGVFGPWTQWLAVSTRVAEISVPVQVLSATRSPALTRPMAANWLRSASLSARSDCAFTALPASPSKRAAKQYRRVIEPVGILPHMTPSIVAP